MRKGKLIIDGKGGSQMFLIGVRERDVRKLILGQGRSVTIRMDYKARRRKLIKGELVGLIDWIKRRFGWLK